MKYGFIGCGNMGGAVAAAVAKATHDIMITDRSGKARKIAEELGILYSDNLSIAKECDVLFLCVKPHMMKDMLLPLQAVLQERKPLLVTMAAGLTMAQIEAFSGTDLPVVRIMPNTPVAVGKGMIQYCRNALVDDASLSDLLSDLRFAGNLDPLDEALIDAASAVSGCGPAYAYLFLEAMADGGVACGIPRAKALEYAAATLAGAAEMYLSTRQHPGALKDAVCSPGGSTIEGIKALEEHGFRGAVIDCVTAAYEKNKKLGK